MQTVLELANHSDSIVRRYAFTAIKTSDQRALDIARDRAAELERIASRTGR